MREQKDRYEIFLKVCETGSFSKAAEALNKEDYTEASWSNLEAELAEAKKDLATVPTGKTSQESID